MAGVGRVGVRGARGGWDDGAELRRALDTTHGEVPYHDLWIGALALQHNVAVVSRDAHFNVMPGVRRIRW